MRYFHLNNNGIFRRLFYLVIHITVAVSLLLTSVIPVKAFSKPEPSISANSRNMSTGSSGTLPLPVDRIPNKLIYADNENIKNPQSQKSQELHVSTQQMTPDYQYAFQLIQVGSVGIPCYGYFDCQGVVEWENPMNVLGIQDSTYAKTINSDPHSSPEGLRSCIVVSLGQVIHLENTPIEAYLSQPQGITADMGMEISVADSILPCESSDWNIAYSYHEVGGNNSPGWFGTNYSGDVYAIRIEVWSNGGNGFCELREFNIDSIRVYGIPLEIWEVLNRSNYSQNTPKNGQGDPRECAINGCSSTQGTAGDPVNTRTGNFDYSLVDLSLQTAAGPLTFQRSYASLAADTNIHPTDLSPGWTHNQDVRLMFETGKVWFKGHTVNQYQFVDNGDQTYTPYPGVLASLTYDAGTSTYTLISSDQCEYKFDAAGALASWRNEQGFGFDYSYSGGKLSLVTEPLSGRYLQFNYQDGRLSSVNDQTNRQVAFGYDASGDLTSFTDVRGYTWSYAYVDHQLTTIKDPLGQTILTNAYDAQGRVYEQFNGKNERIVKIIYNGDGTSTILDALDRQSVDGYDARGVNIFHTDPSGYTVFKEYDANFRLSRVMDPDDHATIYTWSADGANLEDVIDVEGYNTHLTYDPQNHLIQTADPNNQLIDYSYTGGLLTKMTRHTTEWGDITTDYSYTTAADAPQPPGLVKTVTDDLGNTTTLIYDASGQLITIQDAASTEMVKNETRFDYDEYGNIKEITDPLGRVTRFEYDPAGNTRFVIQNYLPGQPQDEQNQYNLTSETIYDEQGRLTEVRGKLDETTWITTSVAYDDAGRIYQTVDGNGKATTFQYLPTGQIQTITDPLNHATSYIYDEAQKTGRLLQVQDAAGRTAQSYTYYADSMVATVTTPTVHTPTDQTDYVVTYHYDPLNRVVGISDNSGHSSAATYDAYGNPLEQTDGLGRVTKYGYNELGLLQSVKQNYLEGVQPDQETNVLTAYSYNALGWLTGVTDANNHTTHYEYDPLGRLRYVTDARLKVTEYDYDQNGNRVSVLDANGNTTIFHYDMVNRLHAIDYPGGVPEDVRLWYDALSRLTGMDDSLGHTAWSYDNLSRINSVTDPFSQTVGYGYDDAGNLTALTYPDGRSINYQYNAVDQLEHVIEGAKHWADYVYDPDSGRIISQTRANGVSSDYAFDYSGQLTGLTHKNAGFDLASYVYHYDAAGNRDQVQETLFYPHFSFLPLISNGSEGTLGEGIESITPETLEDAYPPPDPDDPYPYPPPEGDGVSLFEEVWNFLAGLFGGKVTTASARGELETASPALVNSSPETLPSSQTIDYVYDPLNRLREANYSTGSTYLYTYDAAGNRTSQSINGEVTGYQYDDANQLINAGGVPYTWDDNGNLLNDGNFTYAYDSANRLIAASDAVSSYSFAYDGLGNRYQQTADGQTTTYMLDLNTSLPQVLSDGTYTYLYGLDRLAQNSANGEEFFLPDGLGSVRQLTDAIGTVTFGQAFDPFGNTLGASGSVPSDFGYAGEWTDGTGLQYLRARYYSPAQGRFISRDPFAGYLSQPSTLNAYAYALNNPVTLTDPSGENPLLAAAVLGGLMGGAAYGYGSQVASNLAQGMCFWDALSYNIDAGQVALYAGLGTFMGMGMGGGIVGIQALVAYIGTGATIGTTLSADGDPTNEMISTINTGKQIIQRIPASNIRFTQSSISGSTRTGIYLDDLASEIQNGFFKGYVRVVQFQDKLYSLDNRRLAAFKLLDVNVPVIIEDLSNPAIQAEFARKFTTINNGVSIIIRNTSIIIK